MKNKICWPLKWKMLLHILMIPLSFLLIEVFSSVFLSTSFALTRDASVWAQFRDNGYAMQDIEKLNLWPMVFACFWSAILSGLIFIAPRKVSPILYGIGYYICLAYAIVQTGYFLLFGEMMWIADFRYASEGSDYFSVLLSYPLVWWCSILVLAALGGLLTWKFPASTPPPPRRGIAPHIWKAGLLVLMIAVSSLCCLKLPKLIFRMEKNTDITNTDYNRSMSAEAAYENMFNAHRLYQVCGIYQMAVKDIYSNYIFPYTPTYHKAKEMAREAIDTYFQTQEEQQNNTMTGLLKDKNVILVLMESMDDWMIGEHTPTLVRMMEEGINFTRFYTPVFGSSRTLNSEYCINTGAFLRSSGGYALDYVNNTLDPSLANQLTDAGYSAVLYHYNTPDYYSRGIFSRTMGYSEYVSYVDYVDWSREDVAQLLCDDQLLFDSPGMKESFFREGRKLNFVITRSAHLSYKYNEELSSWGLQKYPEYRGLTGKEETDCALMKARLVDDFFARMLSELEASGQLEDTIIVGVTDHYTYGYQDTASLLNLSGVSDALLLEKTPCFIWGADVPALSVDKVLNTADLLPTMLNLLGVESSYPYLGCDAFDSRYDGFVPFSDGSWIHGDIAYNASSRMLFTMDGKPASVTEEFRNRMDSRVQDFIRVNNLILETDYYKKDE